MITVNFNLEFVNCYVLTINQFIMKKLILIFVSLLMVTNSFAYSVDDDFKKMKNLVGKWTGTLEWSTGDQPETLNLEYSIRSNGSAILE